MSTLSRASQEWATRPADERFQSLPAMLDAARAKRSAAAKASVALRLLKAKVLDGQVVLNGQTEQPANFTNWSFGQIAKAADAPASYLRTLPAPLAADCLNTGLAKIDADKKEALLFNRDADGGLTLRAATSESYSRVWNADVIERLNDLESQGTWRPAPAAYDGSRGLYMGDRDMFCFMVDSDRKIFERLPGGGLSRGFFIWNSEVGAASFGICTFMYAYICGNHIVWEASNVRELRMRHVGDVNARGFRDVQIELRKYAETSAADDELKIQRARTFVIGKSKEEIVDLIFGKRIPNLSRRVIGQAYDLAEKRVDWYGNPRSAWGMMNGVTEIARDMPNADERNGLERAGSKILELAF